MKRISLALMCSLLGLNAAVAQVQINELMQSNIDCIMDDLNQFPDSWVELYNAGSSSVNLNKYSLGTVADGSDAWRLPSRMLNAKSFETVFCDKEATGLHTSFRLESGKDCRVYLFDANSGAIVDSVWIKEKQPAPNIAYGRKTQGSNEWGYQFATTPKAGNSGIMADQLLGEPIFSETGRVLTSKQTLTLTLSMPDGMPEGTVIRYTTDGSEPTASSTLYASPLTLTSTKTIRAKLFCYGYLSPRATTHSFIYLGREMTLPVVSIVTRSSYFNDSKTGIYVDGNYSSSKKNYEYDWRRPINFEYFEQPDSASLLNMLCETRVSGNASRSAMLKSLAIYTHKRFGQKHFKYEFFPDQRPGMTHYKSLVMRNAGNDFDYLYMRDAVIQRSMAGHADLDWQAWRPVIFYLNGTYKGILNIRERSNENNIYTNYDELEDIDMVENWSQLKQGSWESFDEFKKFYKNAGHTYGEYEDRMDLEEYKNLMIMNLYYNNLDFPGNNFMMWRPREEGGRWRFVAKDTDYTMGIYGMDSNYKILEWINNPNYDGSHNWANHADHTLLFRRLMEIEQFKDEFIDRFAVYMGDFLNYDAIWKTWGPMYETIKTEYPNHRKLINQWWPNYNNELSTAQNWVKKRTDQLYSQLSQYYHLGSPTKLYINKDADEEALEGIEICMNGVPLSAGTFNGKFFTGRDVTLSASPLTDEEGHLLTSRIVTGWKVDIYSSQNNCTTQTFTSNTCHFAMPSGYQTVVTPQYGEDQGLEEIAQDSAAPTLFFDLNGRQLEGLHPGINIVRDGNGKTRKIIK